MHVEDALMVLVSSNDERVSHIGTAASRFWVGGLTGLWPPSCQTWHFHQINGSSPT